MRRWGDPKNVLFRHPRRDFRAGVRDFGGGGARKGGREGMENFSTSRPDEARRGGPDLKARLEANRLGWTALAYLILIGAAEATTNRWAAQMGLALHGASLCLLLGQAGLASKGAARRFFLCLALVPLIRLVSLAAGNLPQVYGSMAVRVSLFLAAWMAAREGGIRRAMVGLSAQRLPLQAGVGLSGLALGYLEYHILRPEALVEGPRLELIWPAALILLVFSGFLEELIFRGMLQYSAVRLLGRQGIYYAAAVFAVLHSGCRSIPEMIFAGAVGVYFGWTAQRSGSILGTALAHGLSNVGLFLIFPFLVG
jgi:membrane protease YdiL (CAAX protease family)